VRAETLIQDVQSLEVLGVVEVAALEDSHLAEEALGDLRALVREGHAVALLVDGVVLLVLELGDELVDLAVLQIARSLGLAADDEGRARFVDEDGVDLVHDGEVEGALRRSQRR
jgi:hypothetical protein